MILCRIFVMRRFLFALLTVFSSPFSSQAEINPGIEIGFHQVYPGGVSFTFGVEPWKHLRFSTSVAYAVDIEDVGDVMPTHIATFFVWVVTLFTKDYGDLYDDFSGKKVASVTTKSLFVDVLPITYWLRPTFGVGRAWYEATESYLGLDRGRFDFYRLGAEMKGQWGGKAAIGLQHSPTLRDGLKNSLYMSLGIYF